MTVISLKKSAVPGTKPTTLEYGEIAVNIADVRLFIGNEAEIPQEFGADATETSRGMMSAEDKAKLDSYPGSGTVTEAESAEKLSTAHTFAISGGATAAPASFDGTNNVVLNVTSLDASVLTGTINAPVSGNADTASKLETARGVSISGGATASAVNFDGSKDISLVVSSLDATKVSGALSRQNLATVGFTSANQANASLDLTGSATPSADFNAYTGNLSTGFYTVNGAYTNGPVTTAGYVYLAQLTQTRSGSDAGAGVHQQLVDQTGKVWVRTGSKVSSTWTWTDWGQVYTTATPPVTGHADTADKLAAPRDFSITGAVTSNVLPFDGSANVALNVTSLDAAKLTGTASVNTTGKSAAADKLQTPRKISLSNGATAVGIDFDGSKDITLDVSSVNASILTGAAPRSIMASAGLDSTARAHMSTDLTSDGFVSTDFNTYTGIHSTGFYTLQGAFINGPKDIIADTYQGQFIQMRRALDNGVGVYQWIIANDGKSYERIGSKEVAATEWTWTEWGHVYTSAFPPETGHSDTAEKLATPRDFSITGGATAAVVSFDGTGNVELKVTALDASALTGTISVPVTGNAETASKLATSRTIALSGGVTGVATPFDGSANITIPVSSVDATKVNGVLSRDNLEVAGFASTLHASMNTDLVAEGAPVSNDFNAYIGKKSTGFYTITGEFLNGFNGAAASVYTGQFIQYRAAHDGAGSVSQEIIDSNGVSWTRIGNYSPTGGHWAWSNWASTFTNNNEPPLAEEATRLQTARKINGIDFDGSKDITITTAALTTGRNINGVLFDGTKDITIVDDSKLPLTGGTVTGNITFSGKTAARDATTGTVVIDGGMGVAGDIYAQTVYANVDGDVSGNSHTTTTLKTPQNFSITGGATAAAVSFDGSGAVELKVTSLDASVLTGEIHVPVTGNSASADKLSTAREIAITGDTVGKVDFDGSKDVAIDVALAKSGVTAGKYNSVTVDDKGRVTAGANEITGLGSAGIVFTNSATGLTNTNITNTNTFLNVIENHGTANAKVGASVQIKGVNGLDVGGTGGLMTISPNQNITGNAGTATKLAAARTIALSGGVTGTATPFDGTANIVIPVTSVDASKLAGIATISTTGNAGSADKFKTARTIALSGGVTGTATSFDGSANITIPVTSVDASKLTGTVSLDTTGNAGTADKFKTPLKFTTDPYIIKTTGVTFDGSEGTVTLKIDDINLNYAKTPIPRQLLGEVGLNSEKWVLESRELTESPDDMNTYIGRKASGFYYLNQANTANGPFGADRHGYTGNFFQWRMYGFNDTDVETLGLKNNGGVCQQSIVVTNDNYNHWSRVALVDPNNANYQAAHRWTPWTKTYTSMNPQPTVDKLTTARNITITGGATAAPVAFDGSANVELKITSLDASVLTGEIHVPVTGNSASADKLSTAREIAITGDTTGKVDFDGSKNVAINVALAKSGVTAGTYNSVTVNDKGLVTSATSVPTDSNVGAVFNSSKTGVTNSNIVNTTTFLNIVDKYGAGDAIARASLQIEGVNGISVGGTGGKMTISTSGEIPGNTATATKLKTARTIALSGGVTGTATPFDGSANITIPVTTVDATKLSGTATINTTGSAAKLANAHKISLTGDATGSVTFDGSADVSTALTLSDSGVTAGNYNSITVDAKGRVTAGTVEPLASLVLGIHRSTTYTNTDNDTTFLTMVKHYGGDDASADTWVNVKGINGVTVGSPSAGVLNISGPSNITGNAGTSDKLKTARFIGVDLSKQLGDEPDMFDGSSDVILSISGILATNRGGTGTHVSTGTEGSKNVLSDSPTFTGAPQAPTPAVRGAVGNDIATTAYVSAASKFVSCLVGGVAGGVLNLGEVTVLTSATNFALPNNVQVGDFVIFRKVVPGNILLTRSGLLIEGKAEDLTLDTPAAEGRLVYSGTTYGWVLA